MNDIENKKTPILSMIAGGVFVAYLFVSATTIIALVSSFPIPLDVMMILTVVFAVASFVMIGLSGRDRIRKCRIPLFVATLLLSVANSFVLIIGTFRKSIEDSRNKYAREALESLNIENAKKQLPEKDLILHTPYTYTSKFTYYDDDGEIAKKFKSIEFTLINSSYGGQRKSINKFSSTYFEITENVIIDFCNDFSEIELFKSDIMVVAGGYFACKSYSLDPNEGAILKKMIDDKVSEQAAAYQSEQEENNNGTSSSTITE